jgi:preprotein translocase subunit SecE
MLDKVKLFAALAIVVAGIVAFYYFEDVSLLYRVLGLLVVMGVAAVVALQSGPGRAAWEFGRGALVEVRKVIWPTRKETAQTTLIVFVMVTLVGIALWLFDMLLLWAVKLLTGQGG